MRFASPADVWAWAMRTAAQDIERSAQGCDLNPYCTPGRRNDWHRGFLGKPHRGWGNDDYDTAYQRGRAAAELLKEESK